MARPRKARKLADDPLWFKDAIIYELHVRAFYDADGDGFGDFEGLAQKLDYLQQLGITAIWLLPFYPSPLRDDGYDIADYTAVHQRYGSLKQFEQFLRGAHERGIRVITELVVNHTSDEHAWFQRARRARRDSSHRRFYVWSDDPDQFKEARIIFKDFEHSNWAWDPVAGQYYWHRFYSHQPDLNYDNQAVRKAVMKVVDFWMGLGVDGMRLDAIPYLYQREGTDCENLPETHEFLKRLRAYVDSRYPNRVLLAEANQWPEDAATYFGDGDECHMSFHFPLMPRLFMAIQMEDRFPIIDILEQTPAIAENAQWALFLRNHDELTLEMVTDEERDYMYRVYALEQQARINLGIRRRLAPLLGNNRRAIELMNALLLSMPGTPVIYYGDEIGMGDNIYLGDRNGVRTPMQWSSDRNAGFSRANPQSLYLPVIIDPEYHYETVNVEAQSNNSNSLLWYMKRAVALRKRFKAFGRGTIEFLEPDNRKVLAYVREHEDEVLLIVTNLSRYVQYVQLDLSRFADRRPVELFGRTRFPPIEDDPYMLCLGPHSFYWFALERIAPAEIPAERVVPSVSAEGSWSELLGRDQDLQDVLGEYLMTRRWFAGKDREITEVTVREAVPVAADGDRAYLTLLDVAYTEGDPDTYLLPLGFAAGERAQRFRHDMPQAVVANVSLETEEGDGVLVDATWDPGFSRALVAAIERRRTLRGSGGQVQGTRTRLLRRLQGDGGERPEPEVSSAEQSNTSIVISDRLILKLYRRLQEGINPDLEVGRYLSEKRRFRHIPGVGGSIDYAAGKRVRMTLGILQEYVHNEGDAWRYTLDEVGRFLEQAATRGDEPAPEAPQVDVVEIAAADPPEFVGETIGTYLESARLLGTRTAEMHVALAAPSDDPDFGLERFTPFARRSLYQSLRNLIGQVMRALRRRLGALPEDLRPDAREVLGLESGLLAMCRRITGLRLSSSRMRTHGDYHLGQVLYTGRDFVIIDFEGEPSRSLSERRLKRSPLRDVAGMLRSFHYAASTALHEAATRTGSRHEERDHLAEWVRHWRTWVSAAFLKAYLEVARDAAFLAGASGEELATLLGLYRLEKAVYELGYELANRPGWVWIPVEGILQLWSEASSE